jgi:hypothetical protein
VSAATDATAQALAAVATEKGLPLTADQVSALQEQAAELLATFITGALAKKVQGDEDSAVAGITTLDTAEASARKPR